MTVEIIVALALVVIAIVLFATELFPIDLVALIIMATLLGSGIISPEEGLSGFSNPATITVAAMFVLSAGLSKTGAVIFIGKILTQLGKRNFWLALITIMLTVGVVSAFINNTAAVAIFFAHCSWGCPRHEHKRFKVVNALTFCFHVRGRLHAHWHIHKYSGQLNCPRLRSASFGYV